MKIQDILKQAKPCWKYAARDKEGAWYAYTHKPYPAAEGEVWITHGGEMFLIGLQEDLEDLFGIQTDLENWKDSMICREECGL